MTALPTSLRRTLLALLGFAITIFLMVFYWNQNAVRPATLMNSIFTKMDQKSYVLLPPSIYTQHNFTQTFHLDFNRVMEKRWTYKCIGQRCVREHFVTGTKRIPFMSCAMICGNVNIWPMPTGIKTLSSNSLTFNADQIQLNVQTEFKDAKQLLHNAYDLFEFDLNLLQGHGTHHTNEHNNDNDNDNQTNDEHSNKKSANIKHNCDINTFIINAEIQTMADVYLHMEIDESYELNVTSKFIKCARVSN